MEQVDVADLGGLKPKFDRAIGSTSQRAQGRSLVAGSEDTIVARVASVAQKRDSSVACGTEDSGLAEARTARVAGVVPIARRVVGNRCPA